MLQAKELMVGDWVWYDKQPYQIRQLGIYGEDRDGNDYPAVCIGKPRGVGLILEKNEIQPIPLIPEILKKNGFDKEIIVFGKIIWLLNKEYVIEYRDSGMCFCRKISSVGSLAWICDIKYVHQLQHALRLCGIKKEIEL